MIELQTNLMKKDYDNLSVIIAKKNEFIEPFEAARNGIDNIGFKVVNKDKKQLALFMPQKILVSDFQPIKALYNII